MSKNLNKHIKSDKAKWTITGIVLVLVVVMLVGMFLQMFGQGKVKPSEWFEKQSAESGEVVEIENNLHSSAITPTALLDNSAVAYTASDDDSFINTFQEHYVVTERFLPLLSSVINSDCINVQYRVVFNRLDGSDDTFYFLFDDYYFRFKYSSNNNEYEIDVIPKDGDFKFSTYKRAHYSCSVVNSEFTSFELRFKSNSNNSGFVFDGLYCNNSILTRSNYGSNPALYESAFAECLNSGKNRIFYNIGHGDNQNLNYVGSVFNVEEFVIYDAVAKSLPEAPTKEGYTFKGWYLDEACTQKYTGTIIKSDTVLYAGWEINRFSVTFNSDGGSVVNDITADWNTAVECPTPIREGYTFLGWFFADGTEYANQAITSDITLKAKWEINKFSITFDSDGGSTVAEKIVDWNTVVECPTPTKEGYTFLGWFLFDETQYTNQPIISDTTLKAKWEIKKLSVVLDTNGGDVIADQIVEYGDPAILQTPVREGYIFKGWFVNDVEYTNQPITANTTIKAKWEIKRFTVTFYVDGEFYREMTVDYGTRLADVSDKAELFSQNVISYRFLNADLPVGEFGDMVVIDDMEVEANAPTESDKVIGTIKNNWLSIVLGSVGIIFVIAIISAVATRQKRH